MCEEKIRLLDQFNSAVALFSRLTADLQESSGEGFTTMEGKCATALDKVLETQYALSQHCERHQC